MTFVVRGDDRVLEQVRKQLEKVVTVVRVQDISSEAFVERDLMLVRVECPQERRAELKDLVDIFRAKNRRRQPFRRHDRVGGQRKQGRGLRRRASALWHPRTRPDGTNRLGPIEFRRSVRTTGGRVVTSIQRDKVNTSREGEAGMPLVIYYDNDADLKHLAGKKVAIIGYGSQGHAQAQNLRDSGVDVVVGQRPGSANYDLAVEHGFKPVSAAEAAAVSDIVNILLPDEVQGEVYERDIKPGLKPGNVLMCSHGFNIHFGQVVPPKDVAALLVAPRAPGTWCEANSSRGGGVPCLIAYDNESALPIGLAYAKGIGGTRGWCHQDHLPRRDRDRPVRRADVLCGGVSALVKAGFETLVEAGYQPETRLLRMHA